MPVTINGSDGITNASWTTGTRPSNPVAGQMGYNTDTGFTEIYNGNEWFSDARGFLAEGGIETTITEGGVYYKVHTFTSSGTFNIISGTKEVEYLVVAGGGSDNTAANDAGGGGAGGYRSSVEGELSGGNTSPEPKFSVSSGQYSVIVGAGGSPTSNGEDSSFGPITSLGGGHGGEGNGPEAGADGGSGGGYGNSESEGGDGTPGQGFRGAKRSDGTSNDAGGGGGAGGRGLGDTESPGSGGGDGIESSINGTATYYAGGGGGGSEAADGPGGLGGGGDGGGGTGQNGAPNTGGGAGGTGSGTGTASGGSGIVIIRYQI